MTFDSGVTLTEHLMSLANADNAEHAQRFFKTGPGEYGEGDKFLGLRMPQIRAAAKASLGLSFDEIQPLLVSEWHELRMTALIWMTEAYAKRKQQRDDLVEQYWRHLDYINNWDLVDCSAHKVLGRHYCPDRADELTPLFDSADLWRRRVAILAGLYFIQKGHNQLTLAQAKVCVGDTRDLIQKASGWMLREAGKRHLSDLTEFLDEHAAQMPRTMLRYSIEKLDKPTRLHYMGLANKS
ncbi:DNA alkylation repair protein [Paraferrimonas sedimenticola]|uniref:3-methyladenine DNA glycosylase AlkD n=1 Tax=Paraferrimonas sedimenticola TaxID=375674 RepID=A0AA37RYK8_9GAMM|nr:DNA alkylation repair protein [Paraferrimonas sedimenticola]GLP97830.1 hypothetical protein GCM10007895_31370 [Paraferrimonas sedimenticola]